MRIGLYSILVPFELFEPANKALVLGKKFIKHRQLEYIVYGIEGIQRPQDIVTVNLSRRRAEKNSVQKFLFKMRN